VESDKGTPFEGWTIVELMGHRRLAGMVREVNVAGAGFLRIDVFPGDATTAIATQLIAPAAVYALTPTTEDLARRLALREQPEPVSRWDLPALPAAEGDDAQDHDDEDEYPADDGDR
jgi:hypothetical protein